LLQNKEMLIQTVALKDVKFYALHGYYPEEQLTGNHFLVSIEVTFNHSGDTENLLHTVNYEVLNTIMREEMANTQKMLETVVKKMLDRVLESYPFLLSIEVGIKKMHPPMPGEINHSFVQLHYTAE
jgi:dihydroneopterin aldolase